MKTESLTTEQRSELLRATLAIYRAEANVGNAIAKLSRAGTHRALVGARMRWLLAEQKLDDAKEKRDAVVARICRSQAEARGARWLNIVRAA